MKGSLAFDILTSLMANDLSSESPLPSTSQDFLDPIIRLDSQEEVTQDPRYEEVLQSLYSVDSQSDPLWTSTSSTVSGATSPPFSADSNSADFLSDDSFMENLQRTDVVKVSLKSRIKAKRKASGQEDLLLEEEHTSTYKDDTVPTGEEDVHSYYERKEKNRLAAQKCRTKKRERGDVLERDISKLESKQDNLKDEIQRLQDEHEHLQEVIQIHGVVCPKIRKVSDP